MNYRENLGSSKGNRNVKRQAIHYNLDTIIAVGYRVNSKEATRFRKWATQTLKEYIVKGFILNDDMLKNGKPFGKDYFDELLEKIREIRASERRAYQKIADVFEQCSYDYNKSSDATKTFYAFIQNKLHYAITGKTAAELIVERVNSKLPTTHPRLNQNKETLQFSIDPFCNYGKEETNWYDTAKKRFHKHDLYPENIDNR